MNAKITISDLAALLALRTGRQKPECEDFLKAFFAHIADTLERGENVKIKGFGTFKITTVEARKSVNVATGLEFEIPSHNRVSFVPAKELAAMVNAPFDVFQSIEVSDDIDESMLESLSEKVVAMPEPIPEPEAADPEADQPEEVEDTYETEIGEEAIEEAEESMEPQEPGREVESAEAAAAIETTQLSLSQEPESVSEAAGVQAIEPSTEPEIITENVGAEEETREAAVDKKSSHKFGWGIAVGFVLAVLLCAVACLTFWCLSLRNEVRETRERDQSVMITEEITDQENSVTENETVPRAEAMTAAQSDAINTSETPEQTYKAEEQLKQEAAPTKASDAPIKDKITKTRYLTTMARDHYGAYELWPYIYDANPGLGHPSRIRPGTTIMVPSLSSLGIDPKNPQVIQVAKSKGAAIYARYNERLDGTPLKNKKKSK